MSVFAQAATCEPITTISGARGLSAVAPAAACSSTSPAVLIARWR